MKSFRSILSLLLVLIFLIQLMPLSSIAAENNAPESSDVSEAAKAPDAEDIEDEVATAEDTTPLIVGEVEQRREEEEKHFRMDDGSFVMVHYTEPVHWKDSSGKWQDIDNTLTLKEGRYVAENGKVTKSFAASMGDGELFRITYGKYAVGMTYVVPVDAEKPAQPSVPDSVPEEESESAPSAAVPEDTELAEQSADEDVLLEAEAVMQKDVPIDGLSYAAHQDASVKAVIENTEETQKNQYSATQSFAAETAPSEVTYANADNSIDFLYKNRGNSIKETIQIREQQESYSYSFLMDTDGLTPESQDDGSILMQTKKGKTIFEIPAPFLEDAQGATSDAAKYKLTEENEKWILTVEADAEWMNADERAFPIQLDPTIVARYGSNTVYSTYVYSTQPDSVGTDQEMLCGYDNSLGNCRVALQITNLPQIPSDCTPVSVGIGLYHAAYYGSGYYGGPLPSAPLLVEVRELTDGVMSIGTQTWNTLAPKVSDKVIDYQKLTSQTRSNYVYWDISSVGLKWYANGSTNRGLIFSAPDAQSALLLANLSGSHFVSYGPLFAVQYRSAVGLEDCYTYQQSSAGRAGDVFINDFTNQMTAVHTDLTFPSEATPFTLNHVYNSERAELQFSSWTSINTTDFSYMALGAGWKLSAQQTVVPKTIGDQSYLIYNDEDGTEHFFLQTSSNTYEDEDGLNLKIVKSGATYTMTDEDATNTWVFHNGYLISQSDRVGNTIYYAYNNPYSTSNTLWKPTSGSGNHMVEIVSVPAGQSATRICSFSYNGAFLTSMTDYADRVTTFSIQGENGRNILKYIQDPDENQSRYEYLASNGRMCQIYDSEAKYGLEITTQKCHGVWTVNRVQEYTAPTVTGTKTYGSGYHAYRNSASLTSYRYYGADHVADGSAGGDDIVLYNVLDNWGRTVCSYETDSKKDTILGVTADTYTANSGTNKNNNRRTSASALGLQVENILTDCGAELEDICLWYPLCTAPTATASRVLNESNAHTGRGMLKCEMPADPTINEIASLYYDERLEAGKTYVFSAYVNTDFQTVLSTSCGAYLQISNASNGTVLQKSSPINFSTYSPTANDGIDTFDGGWEKISVTISPTTTTLYRLSFVARGVKGVAYADDFQLERRSADSIRNEEIGAGSTNLLTFGSFDDWPENLYGWTGSDYEAYESSFLLGTFAAQTTGDTGAKHRLSQTVPIYHSAENLTFVLSGWGKANSIASAVAEPNSDNRRFFGLVATITYTDTTTENHYVSFSPDYSGWQFASGNVIPKNPKDTQGNYKTVKEITVSCAYDYNANVANFDNLSLVREPLQTYSYDDDGKLYSATDGNAKASVTYEEGTKLPQTYTTPSGITHSLEYTAYKQLYTETVGNVTTKNYYTGTGNLKSQVVSNNQDAKELQSTSTYSSDGHQKTSSTDANNVRSDYTYSSTTRNPLSSKVGGLSDTQGYSYFAHSDRLKQTYITGKAAILYSYENGTLTRLQRKAFPDMNGSSAFYQRYNLTNDSFGNQLSVSVSGSNDGTNYSSSIPLFSSTYESGVNNGRLHSSTYSNGDTVTYSYDLFDRIVEESYTGTVNDTRHRVYDGMGNIAEETATSGSQTERYTYQYDGLGRLYHSCAYIGDSQTIATSYFYDTANRLKRQSWNIRNASFTQLHSYSSSDGLIESICNAASVPGNGTGALNPTATYTYNSLRQPTRKTVSFDNGNGAGNTEKFYRAFTYRTISGNQTSNQITYLNYRKAGDDLILGFKYGYDQNGRISSIKPSLASGGADNSKAITYTYDGMGQLTECTDKSSGSTVNYSYTYDTAGNILTATCGGTEKIYSYQNASWKDLLTAFNIGGTTKTITYAAPGLPSTWYNGSDYTFTWKKGTQLATATKGSTTTTYSYDMNGVRSAKTVGSTTYQFDTLSGKVMHQTGAGRELWFVYDENGQPYMLITRYGTTVDEYFYLLNAQGDVVGLYNRFGNLIATYTYDPFGAPIGTWTHPDDNVGALNPLRYRGYFYDFESGFYYLQSRYYDPIVGRFISADTFATTDSQGFLSCNMFAYCENDPVNREDAEGTLSNWATKFLIGTAVIAAAAVLTVATAGTGTAVACFAVGALQGSAAGAAIGAVQGAVTGAVAHRITTGSWGGAGQAALNGAADGYMAGAITGFITGGLTSNACFVAGTAVLASTGYVAIESIKAGDYVWAWDEETRDVALKQVVETYVNESTELIHVFVDGEEIVTTPTHPFYSPVKGWTAAVHLRAGDILVLVNDEYVVVEQVQHELLEAPVKVYNFQVEGYHTYYVSNSGVLVHNVCSGRTGKQARLREMANDDKLASHLRGEIKRDINAINRGTRSTIRVPNGYNMAHSTGHPARLGYSYKFSNLDTIAGHRLHHRIFGYKY